MAELIEGLQGSGKSYYAMYKMFHDREKYHAIYTNIDGIKTDDKIKSIQFKEFVNDVLLDIYTQQVAFDGSFEESVKLFQDAGYLPQDVSKKNRVLLVIDEAQNYFGKSVKLEPHLVWLITQHRHLYFEIYLITQKYTLLRNDYHLFNVVYQALPPVKQIIPNKIRYIQYAGLPLNNDNEARRFTLPKEQQVFELYESGDKVDSPNIIRKFIIYFVLLVALLFFLISHFLSSWANPTQEESSQKLEQVSHQNSLVSSSVNPSLLAPPNSSQVVKKLFVFSVWNDGFFSIPSLDETEDYPIELLLYLKEEYFIKVITQKSDDFRTVIHVICNQELETFLNGSQPNAPKSITGNLTL